MAETLTTAGVAPSPERLATIEAKIRQSVAKGRAESTIRTYRSDWADFVLWCRTVGLRPLPAAAVTVAGYVSELAFPPDDRAPAAVSTITRRLAAIGQVHQVAGHPNPCVEQLVRETMKGIRRSLGVAPSQKKAITTSDIKAAVRPRPRQPIEPRTSMADRTSQLQPHAQRTPVLTIRLRLH